MKPGISPIRLADVERKIYSVRGEQIMLDSDLAILYGVSTKAFNQAVKRNRERFPEDFAFLLTKEEAAILRSQNVTSSWGGRRYQPHAFTEHGALMAATVLNSSRAIAMSLYIVRAFSRLRKEFTASVILEKRLAVIEKTLLSHDATLRDVIAKIRPLLLPPPNPPKRRIGFHPDKD